MKQSLVNALLQDVDESEEQYNVAARKHFYNIDTLIDVHKRRLNDLYHVYNDELTTIKREFDDERQLMNQMHHSEMKKLQDILFAMDYNHTEQENEAKQEFQSLRDDIKNKNLEEKHALRIQLESSVENLWKQFQLALKNYNETTEERKAAFELLKNYNETTEEEIDMQMKKLQKLQDTISSLKARIQQNNRECEDRNKMLREEREFVQCHFQRLKFEMGNCKDPAEQPGVR